MIKFIQIGGTLFRGSPALLPVVQRTKIPFSFTYMSEKDAESRSGPVYGFHEPVTIVMVNEGALKAKAEAYANVKDKVIILFPSTKALRDFNLGMAVGTSSTLQSGTYIATQGKVINWSEYKPMLK